MTLWFTSDTHLDHFTVSRARGFWQPFQHDAFLAARWDEAVGVDDLVYVLGDAFMDGRSFDYAHAWFTARPGRKVLVFGNHDFGHPMHRPSKAARERYVLSGMFSATADHLVLTADQLYPGYVVPDTTNGVIRRRPVVLSHFPPLTSQQPDHTARVRFQEWRPTDPPKLGTIFLHGHTHSSVPRRGRCINVAPEAWGGTLVRDTDVALLINDIRREEEQQ